MIKIKLIAVGKIKERYIFDGIKEYEKRLTPFCKLEIVEIKDSGIKDESEKIKKYISDRTYILDPKGSQMSSEEFALFIKKQEQDMTFVIGGSDGITDEVKRVSKLISLSKMTFLHEMCRLFFLEQLYRAFMINNRREYHK